MKPIRVLRFGGSESLTDLIASLKEAGVDNIKKLNISGSTYRGMPGHFIFNWGSSSRRALSPEAIIFNSPEAVALATNKLHTFNKLKENGLSEHIPQYTTDMSVAKEYAFNGTVVYCRISLTGSQGSGILVAHNADEVVPAPLYTMQVPCRREVRIHVFAGNVISFAQKKRMGSERREEEGIESSNSEVRNLGNGWVFAQHGVTIPEDAQTVAINAISALGLDFGACDVLLSYGKPIVLEINTAPGLEGSTLIAYRDAILEAARDI